MNWTKLSDETNQYIQVTAVSSLFGAPQSCAQKLAWQNSFLKCTNFIGTSTKLLDHSVSQPA